MADQQSEPTEARWPEGCHNPDQCKASGFCEWSPCPFGAAPQGQDWPLIPPKDQTHG